ncbi:hypothetical protein B296_00031649 [Ensete ventricosum]|uniref:Uncharacterized protein n=1 Tax=Ensete ventricosum TaxID=4639 RepID=A0A426Y038_ENSVE|nr:hypothetical protein B296_00031649 [Ensete ventricosum]
MENHVKQTAHVEEEYLKTIVPQSSTDRKIEHGAKARSSPWTKVKDINSYKGKSGIVVPWVLHSDGADSFCMVPKTRGASRHMHLVSEMHLMEGLSDSTAKAKLGSEGLST